MDISPHRLLERAKERFQLADYFGCIHLLEDLIEGGRAFADAHHLLGLAFQMIGRPERALESLDYALKLNSRYVEAHIHRGIVLGELGKPDEAEDSFAAARDYGGGERGGVPSHHASKLANLHAELGEAYVEAGALSQAIDQYEAALRYGPEFHDLRYRLGRLLLEAGRSLEAREALKQVADARPGSNDVRSTFGMACYVSGDAGTAREVWEQLLERDPDDTRAITYLTMLDRGANA